MIISYTDIDEQNMAKGKIGMEITQHTCVIIPCHHTSEYSAK
jgi:hypothetical protein